MSAQKQDNDEVIAKDKDQREDIHSGEESVDSTIAGDEKLESPEKSADSLEEQLELAQQKAGENWNLYVRARAEMDNLRRRNTIDLENAHKFALERFAQELLPVKDSLELGLDAVAEGKDEQIAKLREGTELTLKMLSAAME